MPPVTEDTTPSITGLSKMQCKPIDGHMLIFFTSIRGFKFTPSSHSPSPGVSNLPYPKSCYVMPLESQCATRCLFKLSRTRVLALQTGKAVPITVSIRPTCTAQMESMLDFYTFTLYTVYFLNVFWDVFLTCAAMSIRLGILRRWPAPLRR